MIDFFVSIFIALLIVALFTNRLYRLFLWYSLNSLSLGLLAIFMGLKIDDKAMIVVGVITIVVKTIIIPIVLKNLSKKFDFNRQIIPKIAMQYSIMLVPAVLVFTFYLSEPITNILSEHANYVAISIASLLLSLLLIIQHKDVAPRIIGFLSIENALFLLGITATNGMPMLVELGIFFDLLMAIVVINLLFYKEELKV